jgi:uncharacterized coiled-coil protein SlyX
MMGVFCKMTLETLEFALYYQEVAIKSLSKRVLQLEKKLWSLEHKRGFFHE